MQMWRGGSWGTSLYTSHLCSHLHSDEGSLELKRVFKTFKPQWTCSNKGFLTFAIRVPWYCFVCLVTQTDTLLHLKDITFSISEQKHKKVCLPGPYEACKFLRHFAVAIGR